MSVLGAVLLMAFSSPAQAAGTGTTAAPFLTLGFGARAVGLAESFVAAADDVAAVHYNPAGLAGPSKTSLAGPGRYELMFSHAIHLEDVAFDQVALVARPFGLSITHLRVKGIERRTTETAEHQGLFGASDLAIGLSWGHSLGPVMVGATGKFIRQTIDQTSAVAAAADFGVLRRFEERPISVGASVSNLGTKIRFIDDAAPLPLTMRAGVAYGLTASFPHLLSLELDSPQSLRPTLRLGGEYNGFGPFSLRGGYRTVNRDQRDAVLGRALVSSASGLSEFYGLYVGVGLRTRFGDLDYAVIPFGELGQAHRISFSLTFGKPKTSKESAP